ncbi:unnamed protein product [Mytilus edulis]|uniref:Uncharacterized protein n=1 Tax=Mytilus edulis TaxID=6550 RepID=A0A8S3TSP0_MYTED|nr:unnamed protein product [Mytilus edulis]
MSRQDRKDNNTIMEKLDSIQKDQQEILSLLRKLNVKQLSAQGGFSSGNTIRRMLKTLGTNGLWSKYSLKGEKGKNSSSTITSVCSNDKSIQCMFKIRVILGGVTHVKESEQRGKQGDQPSLFWMKSRQDYRTSIYIIKDLTETGIITRKTGVNSFTSKIKKTYENEKKSIPGFPDILTDEKFENESGDESDSESEIDDGNVKLPDDHSLH